MDHYDDIAVPRLQELDIGHLMNPKACKITWKTIPKDTICTTELIDKNACSVILIIFFNNIYREIVVVELFQNLIITHKNIFLV